MNLRIIPSRNNQPGVHVGNVRSPIHPSYQPHLFVPNTAQNPTRILASGNTSTNVDPPPPAVTDGKSSNEDYNTPPDPDTTSDGGMSTLEMMLTPPESDSEPHSKNQDVQVFHSQWQPHIRVGPFYPQPPNPFKERKGAFNRRRNVINARLRRSRITRSTNVTDNGHYPSGDGSDGDDVDDDDDDNDSSHGPNAEAYIPPQPIRSTLVSHVDSPATPRRVLRSQGIDSDSDPQAVSPKTLAPKQKPKRKRDDSKPDITTPTQGQRVSKRQRDSLGDSPLPPMPPVKRTRAEQKKFESKLDHLIFDPERPGSVEREVVEVKSLAKEWRTASLHGKPWDGNPKPE